MIYPYVGDFLISPVPLQLSFNWCSHACSYCFANLNSPGRKFDVTAFQKQLKSLRTTNSLQSVLLKEKYPVLISNLVDPFASSNYGQSVPVIETLTQMGIPVALQTRGGKGIDDVLSFLPKSVWYVSIPMLDDNIRKQVEIGAPSIESRFDLIQKLKEKGHEVLVGVNPTVPQWLPGNDAINLIDKIKSVGVSGIWLAALHLNRKQKLIMSQRDINALGGEVITQAMKDARDITKPTFEFIDSMRLYAKSIGLETEGTYEGDASNFFDPFTATYKKLFPTIHQFINWCWENKKDNEAVYFEEFYQECSKGLPLGSYNISPYMRCMSTQLDKEIRDYNGYRQTSKYLLQLCWNEKRMKRELSRYWSFAVGVTRQGQELAFERDQAEGNKIFYFNRNGFTEEFYINE